MNCMGPNEAVELTKSDRHFFASGGNSHPGKGLSAANQQAATTVSASRIEGRVVAMLRIAA